MFNFFITLCLRLYVSACRTRTEQWPDKEVPCEAFGLDDPRHGRDDAAPDLAVAVRVLVSDGAVSQQQPARGHPRRNVAAAAAHQARRVRKPDHCCACADRAAQLPQGVAAAQQQHLPTAARARISLQPQSVESQWKSIVRAAHDHGHGLARHVAQGLLSR